MRRNCGGIFEGAKLEEQLADIDRKVEEPGFWSDQAGAQKVMQRRRRLEDDQALRESLKRRGDDLGVLVEFAQAGEDVATDLERDLSAYEGEIETA